MRADFALGCTTIIFGIALILTMNDCDQWRKDALLAKAAALKCAETHSDIKFGGEFQLGALNIGASCTKCQGEDGDVCMALSDGGEVWIFRGDDEKR